MIEKYTGGFELPSYCPRRLEWCQPYAQILSSDIFSFFCCGEHTDDIKEKQDKYKVCFRGDNDDSILYYDKRDIIHHASVLTQAAAIIEEIETQ